MVGAGIRLQAEKSQENKMDLLASGPSSDVIVFLCLGLY